MDTQRRLRGHDFLPPDDILSQIPSLYGTENTPPEDKTIFIHYFSGGSDHYIAELEQREEDGHWIGFGWAMLAVHPDGAEWGYADLTELEAVLGRSPQGLPLLVERDCWWTPSRSAWSSRRGHDRRPQDSRLGGSPPQDAHNPHEILTQLARAVMADG